MMNSRTESEFVAFMDSILSAISEQLIPDNMVSAKEREHFSNQEGDFLLTDDGLIL